MDPSALMPNGDDPVSMLLDGLEADDDLGSVHRAVGDVFMLDRSASPRGLLEFAASAFLACGASSADPLEFDELERRYLPEWPARGNTAHQKRRYALQAAILLSSGVEPEDTSWWRSNDLWSHAFDAVIVFVRAASQRRPGPDRGDLHGAWDQRLTVLDCRRRERVVSRRWASHPTRRPSNAPRSADRCAGRRAGDGAELFGALADRRAQRLARGSPRTTLR